MLKFHQKIKSDQILRLLDSLIKVDFLKPLAVLLADSLMSQVFPEDW